MELKIVLMVRMKLELIMMVNSVMMTVLELKVQAPMEDIAYQKAKFVQKMVEMTTIMMMMEITMMKCGTVKTVIVKIRMMRTDMVKHLKDTHNVKVMEMEIMMNTWKQ